MSATPTTTTDVQRTAREATATLLVALAALSFAIISIFTIIATRTGATLGMVILVRYAVAALALAPLAFRHELGAIDRRHIGRLLAVGGIGQSVVAVLTLASLQWIPAATLVVLFYTFPAWVTLLAAIRRTEPLTPRRIVAVALSLAGILALVGLPGGDTMHPTGVALALSAAIFYAFYVPAISRLQVGMAVEVATWFITIGVVVIFTIGTAVRGEFTLHLAPAAWGASAAIGLLSTALGLLLFMRGLAVLGPVRTSIISTVEPIFAALLAAAILDQPITPPMLVGGAMIVAAVVILARPGQR